MEKELKSPKGFLSGIVEKFLSGRLSIIFIIMAICIGVASILVTPREEEPQIVVPLADIYINAPGASPSEIENLISTPLEQLLWQIDGVEYVYSTSMRDLAVVTVRFFVGEERENSLVKLRNKISMNIDRVSPIIKGWVIKPVEIDDVPIVNLTLFSENYDDHGLRRIGEEILSRLSKVKNISRTDITGGRKRTIRVELSPEKMGGMGISILEVNEALRGADASVTAGDFSRANKTYTVTADSFLLTVEQVSSLVVGVKEDRPVHLGDIATIIDGPEEARHYTRIGFSDDHNLAGSVSLPAVTLSIAKKKGTNAVSVASDILKKVEALKKTIIPEDVHIEVTRNYGQTAQEKVNGLLGSLLFAIISVVILLALTLGWREALVVAVAVPISFSLALFVNYLLGYTINRVTLFALILSLGLVVDDPITNVDNIQRHIFAKIRNPFDATLFAVSEVLPPVIMSTIAIIICFTPLFFITGMMGPYMGPMATNVPLTVIFSTLCAITIVPWLAYLLLKDVKKEIPSKNAKKDTISAIYRKIVQPFLESRARRYLLLMLVIGLLVASIALALFRFVPLKLLPFDNKSEFQIVLDMDEGTSLEATDAVIRSFEDYLKKVPEVTSVLSHSGTSSPIDFNGLVRHYYLRKQGNLGDIRVNLMDKEMRSAQSHEIVMRLRPELEELAKATDARIKIVEVPPGPPVLSTIVGEVYGSPGQSYENLIRGAEHLKSIMNEEPFVTDIDDMAETPHHTVAFNINKNKAALHGISTRAIIMTIRTALSGTSPATLHLPEEKHPLYVKIILPRERRSGMEALGRIPIKTGKGKMIPLAEFVTMAKTPAAQPIYHKNLERVVFVLAETVGRAPAEAVLDMQKRLANDPMPEGTRVEWAGEGEWKITLRVFRDMGIAFAAALAGIYILLVIQSNSFFMPVLIMMAIPLTLLGIMPGFFLLNFFGTEPVGIFANPVFFTATSMIGMIALGGIVIRNALVLIEFVHDELARGTAFKEAILQSGAIRMRPIMLTAATTAIGAWPITYDPVFSGLAWALIFGLTASTLFTLVIIPVTYYALYKKKFA